MIREIDGGGSSHLSQNSTIAHFGLGSATIIDSVIVSWSGGNKQVLVDKPANQLMEITEIPKQADFPLLYLLLGICLGLILILLFRKKILGRS